jgi:DNA-binding IclR family transcriptional regulator
MASGRLFGALLPAKAVEPRVKAELERSLAVPRLDAPTRDNLEHEFALIRDAGFAVTSGMPIPGINAVAAPVVGECGDLACVVALVGWRERLPLTDEDPAPRRFLEEVRALQATLGTGGAGMKMRPWGAPTEGADIPRKPNLPDAWQPPATRTPVTRV